MLCVVHLPRGRRMPERYDGLEDEEIYTIFGYHDPLTGELKWVVIAPPWLRIRRNDEEQIPESKGDNGALSQKR